MNENTNYVEMKLIIIAIMVQSTLYSLMPGEVCEYIQPPMCVCVGGRQWGSCGSRVGDVPCTLCHQQSMYQQIQNKTGK